MGLLLSPLRCAVRRPSQKSTWASGEKIMRTRSKVKASTGSDLGPSHAANDAFYWHGIQSTTTTTKPRLVKKGVENA
jgi:hypothetical protein